MPVRASKGRAHSHPYCIHLRLLPAEFLLRAPDMEIDERALRVRAKVELRKRARGLRSAIPKDGIAARSQKIVLAVAALEAFQTARRVALFFPILAKNEVDLRELDARLRAEGKAVYYPSIEDE